MKQFKRLIIPYFIWAVVILLIPLFLIALYAVTKEGNEVLTVTFTWGNFAKFLEATYLNVILKSFWLGLLTTVICLVDESAFRQRDHQSSAFYDRAWAGVYDVHGFFRYDRPGM